MGNLYITFDYKTPAGFLPFCYTQDTLSSILEKANDGTLLYKNLFEGNKKISSFNLDERNIRFFDDALIQVNNTQFRGCDLIFDLNTNRVTAGYSECGENIQITIVVD